LTQAEAELLMRMAKRFVRPPATISLPAGIDGSYELASPDGREKFLLDVWRGTLRLSKLRFQNRARKIIVLVRLDVNGAPHTNPDGTTLLGTHLHIFREGYDDRWALAVDPDKFSSVDDPGKTFQEFCAFCNIEGAPPIQEVIL